MSPAQLEAAKSSQGTPGFAEMTFLPKQQAFIDALWDKTYLLYAGGYRSGKTLVGCYAGILLSILCPNNVGLIGRQHARDMEDSTRKTFFQICPQSFIKKWRPSENYLLLKNDSEIYFRHLDDPKGRKGIELGWAYIDEITDTSYDVLTLLISRLSLPVKLPTREVLARDGWSSAATAADGVDGRKLFATTNTDAPGHWVHRAWFGPPPKEGIGLPAEKRFAISSSSKENTFLISDLIDEMDRSFDPQYHERFVQGKWIDIGRDRTYYCFDREKHVKPCPVDEHRPLIISWDFNCNPMASVILQQAGFETRVVDEIVLKDSNTPEVCDEFLQRYGSLLRGGRCPGVQIYGDATSNKRAATAGKSDYAVMAQKFQGLPSVQFLQARSNPKEIDRTAAVNARLLSQDGTVSLVIDPKCVALATDFEMVCNKKGTRNIDMPTTPQINKGSDPTLTHPSDALGYYIAKVFPVKRPGQRFRTYNARL